MGSRDGLDRLTLIAIAIVAYALANVAHEGIGHAGACLALGGRPVALSAVHFESDLEGLPPSAERWEAAGGTLVNVAIGLAAFALFRRGKGATATRYFLWLFGTLNLIQGSVYWLCSGIGNVGDWAAVVEGWQPAWAWRTGLAVVGGAAYWATVLVSLRLMVPFLGAAEARLRRAITLTVVPYLAGGALYVLAGLPNPHGMRLVVVSATAASFGGASAFAWMAQKLRDEAAYPPDASAPLALERSWPWAAAGILTAAFFIFVLGPSIRF